MIVDNGVDSAALARVLAVLTGEASCSNRIRRASRIAAAADRFCEFRGSIFPFIQRVFADSGHAGEKVTTATLIAVEIVRKNRDQIGFAVNPRRPASAVRPCAWLLRPLSKAIGPERALDPHALGRNWRLVC